MVAPHLSEKSALTIAAKLRCRGCSKASGCEFSRSDWMDQHVRFCGWPADCSAPSQASGLEPRGVRLPRSLQAFCFVRSFFPCFSALFPAERCAVYLHDPTVPSLIRRPVSPRRGERRHANVSVGGRAHDTSHACPSHRHPMSVP